MWLRPVGPRCSPSRIRVIEFYRSLGYTETEPFETEPPAPMTYLHRMTTPQVSRIEK